LTILAGWSKKLSIVPAPLRGNGKKVRMEREMKFGRKNILAGGIV
jgi:hypothetical protein